MSPSRFTIAPTLLGGISTLVPEEKSPLSPLRIPNAVGLSLDQQSELESSGLLQAGRLHEEASLLLNALRTASAFTRLRLNTSNGFLDEAVYFNEDQDHAQPVQISITPEGLTISAPSNVEALLARVTEFTGPSSRPGNPWSEELPPLEGLVLAGLLDMRRKAVIRALLDNQAVTPPPSDFQSVSAAINGLLGNAQWFTATVLNVCNLTVAPPPVQVQTALDSLEGKRRVWHQGADYFPLPEAIQAADRFLITNILLSLDLGHANSQGKAAFSRVAWLQSGVNEMFHVHPVINQIRLETVSPAAALDEVRYHLTHPEALPAPPADQVQLAVAIQAGLGAGQTFPLGDETVLGRSEQANIRILDARASRRHSVIRRLEQGYQLSDAGSTNGTYFNGQLLTEPVWLKEGDVIGIGETRIAVIRTGATPPAPESQRTIFNNEGPRPVPAESSQAAEMPEPPAEPQFESAPPEPLDIPDPVAPEAPQTPSAAELAEQPAEPQFESDPPEPIAIPEPDSVPAQDLPKETEPNLHQCPRCGNEVPPGARFCGACGFQLIE